MDPSQKDHETELGCGRLVMLFKCWFNVKQGSPLVQRDLAFIEVFWPYKDPSGVDTLCDDFGCTRLYSTSPQKVYYVIDVGLILGPAPITRDPVRQVLRASQGLQNELCMSKYYHKYSNKARACQHIIKSIPTYHV